MTEPAQTCAAIAARAPELVRDPTLPAELAAHVAACPACAGVLEGARRLRGELAAWAPPAPPADLVERALARVVVASLAAPLPADRPPSPADGLAPITKLPAPRRRSSVELLTSVPFAETAAVPPSRRQLVLRIVSQAAAAVVLFAVSTTFVAVFYPAITHAIEQKHIDRCKERLRRLADAARRYRREHADGPALSGVALRTALIDGGYVDRRDLECPGPRGHDLGANSFCGDLPALEGGGQLPPDQALFWDRFGNHAEGFNVVHADGRCETVDVESLDVWLRARDAAQREAQGDAGPR